MTLTWKAEDSSLIDRNILSAISLIEYLNYGNSDFYILIGSRSWVEANNKNKKETLVCFCTDDDALDISNSLVFKYKDVFQLSKNITLSGSSGVKGISFIDGYRENKSIQDFVKEIKKFTNMNQSTYIPKGYNAVLLLSHDIDYINTNLMYRMGRLYYLLSYLRLGKPQLFIKNLPHFTRQFFLSKEWAHHGMLELERERNISSTWFLFSTIEGNSSIYNPSYLLSDPETNTIIEKIQNNNSEIALHGSPESAYDKSILLKEKENIEQHIKQSIIGNRHHMGRFHTIDSIENWIDLGFVYDSSFLTNDLPLDIASTNHFFDLFNSSLEKSIVEFPTAWMDVQYLNFLACNQEEFTKDTYGKIDYALDNNLVFSMNWHGIPYNWYLPLYEKVLDYCMESGFYVSSYRDYLNKLKSIN